MVFLNWLANIKWRGPEPPGSILLLGAHLNWLAKIILEGPGPLDQYYCLRSIQINIVGGPFKLVGKNYIEGALDQYYCRRPI